MATHRVPYRHDGRRFEGVRVRDHAIEMARAVAGRDYVVMVADMFGADSGPMRHDEKLCRQSYRMMREFFTECWAARGRIFFDHGEPTQGEARWPNSTASTFTIILRRPPIFRN